MQYQQYSLVTIKAAGDECNYFWYDLFNVDYQNLLPPSKSGQAISHDCVGSYQS